MTKPPTSLSHFPDSTSLAQAETASPSVVESVSQTVFKLSNILISGQPISRQFAEYSPPSLQLLTAMQRLVEIIEWLHLTMPTSNELTAELRSTWPLMPENLIPYVSEEAYEVLDAIERDALETLDKVEQTSKDQPNLGTGQFEGHQNIQSSNAEYFVSGEELVSYLLWGVARSSYKVMQLIEGVKVSQIHSSSNCIDGILRLVVLLEIVTPFVHGCFDLATGALPGTLLDEDSLLQSDEKVLPVHQSPFSSVGSHQISDRPIRVADLLSEVLQQVRAETPEVEPWLDGISVDFLQPGQNWQIGQIQLKLGFEFIDQSSDAIAPEPAQVPPDLIDAELMEDASFSMHSVNGASRKSSATRVSLVELPRQILESATLVRLTDEVTFKQFVQSARQHQLAIAGFQLQQSWADIEVGDRLLQIVQKAYAVINGLSPFSDDAIELLQPALLMDELIPKLLWQITRSFYEVTQLMGGIDFQVLQPGVEWERGTLRLLVGLQIQSASIRCMIDLATGRPITSETALLKQDAICQLSAPLGIGLSSSDFPWQQTFQAEFLLRYLQQQIQTDSPQMTTLMEGTSVEWLEANRDWQSGIFRLTFQLEFIPNRTQFV